MPHNINISKDHVQMNHTLLLRPTKVLFSSSSRPPPDIVLVVVSLFESSAMCDICSTRDCAREKCVSFGSAFSYRVSPVKRHQTLNS